MGDEGNLNLGQSMEEAPVEENLACSLTDIFDILNEDPRSPPVNEDVLFESKPEIHSPNLFQGQEGNNLWGMENGNKTAPQPFENAEMFCENYFPMVNLAQQDDPDNFCNVTDTEQWMSTISNCDLDLNLNLNTTQDLEGQVKGEFSGYQWGSEFDIQPQLNNVQFQPQLNNQSSSYYGVGESSQSCLTEPHEGSAYGFPEMNFLDQSLQMPTMPLGIGIGPKIEEEEEQDEACEELSDDMYMSVSDISDADDSSPLPSSTDSSPLPSKRNFAKQLSGASGGINNPVKKCLEMNNIAEDDDVSIIDCTVGKPPIPPIYGRPTFGQTSSSYLPSLAMRYKSFDERTTFRLALQDLSQPKSEAVPPEGTLAVDLLRHQKIALAWMVQKETRNPHCSGGILADDQGLGKTVSTISLILTERSPPSSQSVTMGPPVKCETLTLDDDEDEDRDDPNADMLHAAKKPRLVTLLPSPPTAQTTGRLAAGTLVVCPTSVLRQWADELEKKVSKEAKLSYLVYHGSGRTKDPAELAKYDVVLTTYAIVTMEAPKHPDDKDEEGGGKSKLLSKKRKKQKEGGNSQAALPESLRPLGKVWWFRVILDEAQSIKNYRTQVARACWGLRAKRRWCLSGTPMQNAVEDLYSYFRFLRYEPYSTLSSFVSMIKNPISKNSSTGYKKLQAVLKTIMLRRTKGTLLDGKPIINLPSKTVSLKRVRFSPDERSFYSALEAESRAQFKVYADAGTVKQNYVNILLMLLRLRQACNHPLMVNGCNSNTNWRSSVDMASKLPREKQAHLLSFLEASSALCGLCNDAPEDAVVTTCEHVFCNQCISERLTGGEDSSLCPKCRSRLSLASLFTKSALKSSLSGGTLVKEEELSDVNMPSMSLSCTSHSSKIKMALDILHSLPPLEVKCEGGEEIERKPFEKKPVITEKAIVFSQWTRMLDMLEAPLKESRLQYRRLDGTMSVTAREKAINDFKTLPEVAVMMMSLKAASLGLNMVAANHVILLDLWWNPTTEDQAIDRAHRIGQSRPVCVSRLTVENTVEDRILALQQKKREMVASAFGEDEMGSHQTRLTVEDLEYLFR
ncbi:SWI/SNF-related matrix-associated actin-dependent regulator [Carex littledalei]|uniref:SWI/SNF-related matrix-associated actin-dependent regulator n=1 Tax=Carex littledalei TaxID=544730 RepID=A0A833RED7_9POAL|nr:SWI/SNF-related matrix-associated actin-dependent regulator [Carex littledalei]